MATVIKPKRSESSGAPATGDLEVGELAINLADGYLYSKNSSNSIVQLLSYDADLFQVPSSVDLGLITDTSTTGTRDLGSIA